MREDLKKMGEKMKGPGAEPATLLVRLTVLDKDLASLVQNAEAIERRLVPVDEGDEAKGPDSPPTLLHLITDLETRADRLRRALNTIGREFSL